MEEKILTLHPQDKQGVNISRAKYERIRKGILDVIEEQGEIRFKDLPAAVESKLQEPFDGSLSWYVTTVKLDLKARDLIERVPGSSPQELRIAQQA
jgi:hypothetical protein